MTSKLRSIVQQLSRPLAALAAALFAGGVISGWPEYLARSPVRQKYVPGTSAWWPHIILAAAACVLLGCVQWRRRSSRARRPGRPWLLAPFGHAAGRRVVRTARAVIGREAAAGRGFAALALAAVFGYSIYRAGLQVIGGLDPNSTVHAWGGPSYLGAMACHYLDCLLMMAAAAWLLSKVLLPDGGRAHSVPGVSGGCDDANSDGSGRFGRRRAGSAATVLDEAAKAGQERPVRA